MCYTVEKGTNLQATELERMNLEYKFSYDKLWHKLIDMKMKKKDLQLKANLTTNAIAKMGRGESVPLDTIAKICTALSCGISDIVELIPLKKPLLDQKGK